MSLTGQPSKGADELKPGTLADGARPLTPNLFTRSRNTMSPLSTSSSTTSSFGSRKFGERKSRRNEGAQSTERPKFRASAFVQVPPSPTLPSGKSISTARAKGPKSGTASAINSHYRNISRSVNDIFARSTDREASPRRNNRENGKEELNLSGSALASARRPKSSAVNGSNDEVTTKGPHAGDGPLRDEWINAVEVHSNKKMDLKESWKLYSAILTRDFIYLYKAPTILQLRSFDVLALPPRPKTAPTASTAFNDNALRHVTTERHPDLVIGEDGSVSSGTVEAICHEIMFGTDEEFVRQMVLSLPAWTGPETAISMFTEYAEVKDLSGRICYILQLILDSAHGLLVEPGFYNATRTLISKGVTPRDQIMSDELLEATEMRASELHKDLADIENGAFGKEEVVIVSVFKDKDATLSMSEFMNVDTSIIADQICLFHKDYLSIWNPLEDVSLLMVSPHSPPPIKRNPLVFTTTNVHFLGDKILNHLLDVDITTEQRSQLLSKWIDIGELLQDRGDMVGWFAVTMAVLSPPILRLRNAWNGITMTKLKKMKKEWATVMLDLERRKFELDPDEAVRPSVMAPGGVGKHMAFNDVIPYFGDLCQCMNDAYESRDKTVHCKKFIEGFTAVEAGLERWRNYPVPSESAPPRKVVRYNDFQSCLHALNNACQNPPSIYSEALFNSSTRCEAVMTGAYLQAHYQQRLPLTSGTSIPLAFTDTLPRFALFDRADILAIAESAAKKTSSSTNGNGDLYTNGNFSSQSGFSSIEEKSQLRRTRSFPPSKAPSGYNDLDIATRQRTAGLHARDQSILRALRDVAGVDESLLYSQDGELALKRVAENYSSDRPSSVIERNSKRFSSSSKRMSFTAEKNVMEKPSLKPLDVVAKAGTLERLVDLLVLGVDEFSQKMSSPQGASSTRLHMDKDVYLETFLATFRSYCSPIVLLDYLKKRLLGAKSAASAVDDEADDVVFPDWTGINDVSDDLVDWQLVAKIHCGIFEVAKLWVDEFFVDFESDLSLRESFLAFLVVAAKEFTIWEDLATERQELQIYVDQIENLFEDVREKFEKQSFWPSHSTTSFNYSLHDNIKFPDGLDILSVEFFINEQERYIVAAYQSVELIDWMLAFEVLENQSLEQDGFLLSKDLAHHCEDDGFIQNILLLLNNLISVGSTKILRKALPRTLQCLVELHMQLERSVARYITEININAEERSQRIYALLRSVGVCNKRMSTLDLYDKNDQAGTKQQVPSFVGSAISMALVRPESRLFAYAWSLASEMSNCQGSAVETLRDVVPNIVENLQDNTAMAPCVGWMFERMLEIICNVPNMHKENSRLINFDKRRYVYNLISTFTQISSSEEIPPVKDAFATTHIKPLLPKRRTTSKISDVDRKTLKEFSSRENNVIKGSRIRVFSKLLAMEHEKQRRDNRYRESLERSLKDQVRSAQRKSNVGKPEAIGHRKGGKRLGVTIFKAVRPLSVALSSTWTPPSTGRVVGPHELPSLIPINSRGKPSIVIELATISQVNYPYLKDKFSWRIQSDGPDYILQATSEASSLEWVKAITGAREIALLSQRSMTSEKQSKLAQIPRLTLPSFGVPLEELCKRDRVRVPKIIEAMLTEIESRGLDEVGIYRVPGSMSSIAALKHALDNDPDVKMNDDRWYDINAVAGAFKLFMRDIPHPLFEKSALQQLKAISRDAPEAERCNMYHTVLREIPIYNYYFLRRMYLHLHRIAANSEVNKMTPMNLAIVFGMGVSSEPGATLGINSDFGIFQSMVRLWISYAPQIFSDLDDQLHEHEHGNIEEHTITLP